MNWTKEELMEVLKNNPSLKIRKGDLDLLPDEPKGVILKPSVKGGWREDLKEALSNARKEILRQQENRRYKKG